MADSWGYVERDPHAPKMPQVLDSHKTPSNTYTQMLGPPDESDPLTERVENALVKVEASLVLELGAIKRTLGDLLIHQRILMTAMEIKDFEALRVKATEEVIGLGDTVEIDLEDALRHTEPPVPDPTGLPSPATPRNTPRPPVCESPKVRPPPIQTEPSPLAKQHLSSGDTPRKNGEMMTATSSKSSFRSYLTAEQAKGELAHIFETAEHQGSCCTEHFLRPKVVVSAHFFVTFCILLNAFFIGYTIDATEKDRDFIQKVEATFSCIFLLELTIRMWMDGGRRFFFGPDKYLNLFDMLIVLFDVMQSFVSLFPGVLEQVFDTREAGDTEKLAKDEDTVAVSMFRILRIARLLRLVRLLREPIFETPLLLLTGVFRGVFTLFFAMILFVLTLYLFSLSLREVFGRSNDLGTLELFATVPRSILTTFRCAFGDCTDQSGNSLIERIHGYHGTRYSFFMCLVVFAMVLGVFNIIIGVFVQNIMQASSNMETHQKEGHQMDHDRWVRCVNTLTWRMAVFADYRQIHKNRGLSLQVDDIYDMVVTKDIMAYLCRDEKARKALADLDIDPRDMPRLFDIMDPHHGKSLHAIEFIEGLQRLRGEPRRSDLVTIELLVRTLQHSINELRGAVIPYVAMRSSAEQRAPAPHPSITPGK